MWSVVVRGISVSDPGTSTEPRDSSSALIMSGMQVAATWLAVETGSTN